MGRGRQKAKHTKIARELKSFSPSVNYAALERELGTHTDEDAYVEGSKTTKHLDKERAAIIQKMILECYR